MNDSKYGRLYPERAVALAREVLAVIADRDGGVFQARAQLALGNLDVLGFPQDEPLLLLRGQDVLAPDIVREYAHAVARNVNAFAGPGQHHRQTAIEELVAHADAMARWQPRKLPD